MNWILKWWEERKERKRIRKWLDETGITRENSMCCQTKRIRENLYVTDCRGGERGPFDKIKNTK